MTPSVRYDADSGLIYAEDEEGRIAAIAAERITHVWHMPGQPVCVHLDGAEWALMLMGGITYEAVMAAWLEARR